MTSSIPSYKERLISHARDAAVCRLTWQRMHIDERLFLLDLHFLQHDRGRVPQNLETLGWFELPRRFQIDKLAMLHVDRSNRLKGKLSNNFDQESFDLWRQACDWLSAQNWPALVSKALEFEPAAADLVASTGSFSQLAADVGPAPCLRGDRTTTGSRPFELLRGSASSESLQ